MDIKITGVTVNMTASDWELYTSMRGSNIIAANLNRKFERCVKNGMTANETYSAMSKLMCKYGKFGAADSEPFYHLSVLMRKVFPAWN
jgi:hypothetical protein